MSLWSKIDNFFSPKPASREGAAAAAAADIPLFVLGLISRPERAKDLIERAKQFKKLARDEQAEKMMPLYLDLEAYVIEHEPIKKYTKESLRLEIYTSLNLKNSTVPFVGFFTPELEGAILLMQELFSKWADPAFEVLGRQKVGEILLLEISDTVFKGVEYKDGVLDFSAILPRLEKDIPQEKEFKKVFSKASDALARPVVEFRGTTPDVYLLRKRILDQWHLLTQSKQPAWQEQKAVIPITPQAREIIASVGLGGLITSGAVSGMETQLVTKQGKPKAVSVSASALKDEAGNISGMVIAAKDLTEIRKLEQDRVFALETAKEQAEGLVREKTTDLEASKLDLQEKLNELERFNKVAVGRELKMIQLKKEISKLQSNATTNKQA
jgi:hypothetical protein